MSRTTLVAAGNVPKLRSENLSRLAVYIVRGNTVLAETPVANDGSFRFNVAESVAREHGVSAIIGPKGVDHHALLARADLPRVPLASARAHEGRAGHVKLDFSAHRITDEIVDLWWLWCSPYTVSGTLRSADGCPVPGAQVTVYNVTHGTGGLVRTPRDTVQTGADGTFTATFNWCECLCCWPCWPSWWFCWPWWWELDIVHILDTLDRQLPLRQNALGAKFAPSLHANVAPLKRPATADLMTGQAFAHLRSDNTLVQDTARTAKISARLSDPAIRELFPWWWWCCDEPNILFSATQNGNTVLDEDPNTDTRWCFESGQTVSLIANDLAISLCPPPPPPVPDGFGWIQVGNTLVADITQGYANGATGTDASDMAFGGWLDIYGGFSDPNAVAFYQVLADGYVGNGNPRRGGTPNGVSQPLSVGLGTYVVIARNGGTFDTIPVDLGPCSFNGISNLYMTTQHRANPPAGVTGLGAFPALNAGDLVIGWYDQRRIVGASAGALIGGAAAGGVDLTLAPFDIAGNPVTLTTIETLTLMIDTTYIYGHIDSLTAYDQNHNLVSITSGGTNNCPSYRIGEHGYLLLHVTVTDPNGHLSGYEIDSEFGHGPSPTPPATDPPHRGYNTASGPPPFLGVDGGYGQPSIVGMTATTNVSFKGGGDTITISPTVSCCYDFRLNAGKRVTNGTTNSAGLVNQDFWTVSIDTTPIP